MAITGPMRRVTSTTPKENCHIRTQKAPDTFRPGFFPSASQLQGEILTELCAIVRAIHPGEEFEAVGKRALQMRHWSSRWYDHRGTSSPESHLHSYPEVLLRTSTGRTLISAASCQNSGNWQAKTQESQRYHGKPIYMPTAVRAALLLEDPRHVSGSMKVQLQLITYTLIKKKKKRLIFRDESKMWVIVAPLLTGYLK